MPAFNCERYVADALESLIGQSYQNIEVVIVDDHSTDGTWAVIKEYAKKDSRIRPYRNAKNLKIVETLNFAISKSNGKYLARMDGDDMRTLDGIEKQVEFMEAHEEVAIVGGYAEVCDENMNVLNIRKYGLTDTDIRRKLFRYSPFTHAAIMMRASLLPERLYRLDWAEDYDMYFRLGKAGTFANLATTLYRIRTHGESVSQTKARYQEKLTLYIRLKAVFEYGYTMSLSDKVYFGLQLITMYMMPPRFRFWLFNKIRSGL